MICEPNYYLPQSVGELFPEEVDHTETTKATTDVKYHVEYEADDYRVLPLLSFHRLHIRQILSIKKNEFLNLRWKKFLERIPSQYATICLYKDFTTNKTVVRRMQLNGQFYGPDNKLSPVPYFPDPRQ